jgi:hypothetical protein
MNWLARLKKSECFPNLDATETTERISVVSVAPVPEPLRRKEGDALPAPGPAVAWDTAPMIDGDAAPSGHPDRWVWPHSEAMNGAEIDTFMARLARFTDKGLSLGDAERLAYRLVTRDRGDDDRRLCLECTHLKGTSIWRCGNWQRAGVATRAGDAQLPRELVMQLQRCDGLHAVSDGQVTLMISENLGGDDGWRW